MEATYRRTAQGKRRVQSTKEMKQGEKRKLIQLLVSLVLFLLVFIGRGVFPTHLESLNELLSRDADFAAAFDRFGDDIAGDESVWTALTRMTMAAFGAEVSEPSESETPQLPVVRPEDIELLGDQRLHGLHYVMEHGVGTYDFAAELSVSEQASANEETVSSETVTEQPEVVTAVAQTYDINGEALPSNVSFAFYELGLENTAVPVMGTVTSEFGFRTGPISGKHEFHLAIDIAASEGTAISAFADGVVRYIGESDSFGLYLMIDHDNGVSTFYAHCSKLLVRKGDVITCGQTVALVGETGSATGPHLHFTLLKDDIRLDPSYYVDPEQ